MNHEIRRSLVGFLPSSGQGFQRQGLAFWWLGRNHGLVNVAPYVDTPLRNKAWFNKALFLRLRWPMHETTAFVVCSWWTSPQTKTCVGSHHQVSPGAKLPGVTFFSTKPPGKKTSPLNTPLGHSQWLVCYDCLFAKDWLQISSSKPWSFLPPWKAHSEENFAKGCAMPVLPGYPTHTIHGHGVFTYMWVIFMVHVGR